ncbi:MAG TPA: rhomboid family intramembrane serine protease [Opitutaceae bacterium]|nr:rhomboid family intramembrane serine protease [Opitutaceae bacterium]
MPSPDPSGEAAGDPIPADLAEAGVYPTVADGFEHGLVVLAMGRPYWLVPFEARFRLLVEPQALGAVRGELACFDRESIGWPPRPPAESPMGRFELATPLLWALLLMAVYCGQGVWPGRLEDAGALDTQSVFDRGEWWRLGTALFLHADLGHLISNELSGVFAFSAVVSTCGRRRGWLLLALASVTGNLGVAALNYPGPYRSLGASTAIFAGLGLLTGRAIRAVRRDGRRRGWQAVFAPLAAGITLLGLFGAGGIHIDVGAHATGFAAGLAWGFAAGESEKEGA